MENNQGNTSAAYSVEAKERLRLGGAAGPAVQMQFKSPKGKNPRDEQPANKHAIGEASMPSTSFALGGITKRNTLKNQFLAEAANSGNDNGNRVGQSSSWISSLQRNSSAK